MEGKSSLSSSAKIILLCTILLIVFLSGAMIFMWSYLQELSGSPLIVGARKVAQANGAEDLMCTCQLVGVRDTFQSPTFYFNTTRVWDQGSQYAWAQTDAFDLGEING